jgi:molybdopterin-guanine dinucleotide biosynthesis protein A
MDGFVLAGGAARRMGVDKARVPFPGRFPMAAHVAGVVAAVCGRVAIVRATDDGRFVDPAGTSWPIVVDGGGDRHPLRGIAAALAASTSELALIVACDLPYLTVDDLRAVIAANGVASDGKGVQPLVAVLPKAWEARARALADAGAAAKALVDGLPQVVLPAASLVGFDAWPVGRPGPVRALLAGLPWLDGPARRRVAQAEIARLAARGVVDPDAPDGVD